MQNNTITGRSSVTTELIIRKGTYHNSYLHGNFFCQCVINKSGYTTLAYPLCILVISTGEGTRMGEG